MMFQFVANGFRWKDDDQLRAAILGSLNGLLVVGDWLEMGVQHVTSRLTGAKTYFFGTGSNPVFENTNTLIQAIDRMSKMVEKKDYSWKDVTFALDKLADFTSKIAGVPYSAPKRIATGVYEYATGRGESPMKLLGYSGYALGVTNRKSRILDKYEKYYEIEEGQRSEEQYLALSDAKQEYNKLAAEKGLPKITRADIRARSKKAYMKKFKKQRPI